MADDERNPVNILAKTLASRRKGIKEDDLIDMFTEFQGADDYRAHLYHRFIGNIMGVKMASNFADIEARCRLSLGRRSRDELVKGLGAIKPPEEIPTYGPPMEFVRKREAEEAEGGG